MPDVPKDEAPALSVYSVGSQRDLVPVKSRAAYLKKRKISIIVIVVLAVTVVILVACLVVLWKFRQSLARVVPTCETEECVRIAASLKESMDTSVDPCDDFYRYACGRWSEEHSATLSGNSWFEERTDRVLWKIRNLLENGDLKYEPLAVKHAQNLYDSCLDIGNLNLLGLEPLFSILKEFDLPEMPVPFSDKRFNFVLAIAKIRRRTSKNIFVEIDVSPDPRNTSTSVIYIDTPPWSNPIPSYNSKVKERLKNRRRRYEKVEELDVEDADYGALEKMYLSEILEAIWLNGTAWNCSSNEEEIATHEEEIKNVAERIYGVYETLYNLRDRNETELEEALVDEDYMLVDTLQELTDEYVRSMNSSIVPRKFWRPFIQEVFLNVKGVDLNKDKILVFDINYMMELAYFLETTDEETLETAIWWAVVDMLIPHSSRELRWIWKKYLTLWTQTEFNEPRSLYCAEIVNEMMAMAVSYIFVDENFDEKKGVRVVEMFEDIRYAFAKLVWDADWMDSETKFAMIEKAKKMSYAIGHPKWLFDPERLDNYYENIYLRNDTFLQNLIEIVYERSEAGLNAITKVDPYKDYWGADPTDVNAVHTFILNHITGHEILFHCILDAAVPEAILQFPFYDLGLEALNYGAIGMVLGHELTHGFDHSGRLFDKDGNIRQWWSNHTIDEYNKKIECFIDHYDNYYLKEVDDHVDGKLTLDENIADNGGLREAVHAYKRWKSKNGRESTLPGFSHLTSEQLLFLGFAHLWCEVNTPDSLEWKLHDSHSPGFIRLQAVLRNSNEFSEAWKCPQGSNMNPKDKCHLW